MTNKTIDILSLAAGLLTTILAIAFMVCVTIEHQIATPICGMILLLSGGIYIGMSVINIMNKYVSKR